MGDFGGAASASAPAAFGEGIQPGLSHRQGGRAFQSALLPVFQVETADSTGVACHGRHRGACSLSELHKVPQMVAYPKSLSVLMKYTAFFPLMFFPPDFFICFPHKFIFRKTENGSVYGAMPLFGTATCHSNLFYSAQYRIQCFQQFFNIDRLRDMPVHAAAQSLLPVFLKSICSHCQYRNQIGRAHV